MSTSVVTTEANSTMVQLMRLSLGWPKNELAKRAGVSASHVTRVETGTTPLSGKALRDYAAAFDCSTELLCLTFRRTPTEGTHFRANATAAEWKRDRVAALANLAAFRIGRLLTYADVEPSLTLPHLDPDDYAAEYGEISVAQVLRRLWRQVGPVENLTALLEAAGIFVVAAPFPDTGLDGVSLRGNEQHPPLIYINEALPADRYRLTLAHELGHLVMDDSTLASADEIERRATSFGSEFLAPYDDIAYDLARVTPRTVYELDELRLRWGVSTSSLVVRAHDRGMLSKYQYRSLFRILNETGRLYGNRPGVSHEQPRLVSRIANGILESGYSQSELDGILQAHTAEQRAVFGIISPKDTSNNQRHLTMV